MKVQAYPIDNFDTRKYPVGCVTQYFGENPQLYKFTKAHSGWDIVSNKVDSYGLPVYSMYDCEVFLVDDDKMNGTGLSVTTINNHGILCLYGHLSEILVKEGDLIKAGQTIGRMGNTGFVVSDNQNIFWDGKVTKNTHAGTHLHITFKRFIPYENYIPRGSVLLNSPSLKKAIVILDYYDGYFGGVDPAPFFGLGNAKVLFTKDMKEGDENDDVRNLQIMLGVTPTGYYGPKTKAAVLSFQINNGIPLTFWERYVARGKYCGPKTREKLNTL